MNMAQSQITNLLFDALEGFFGEAAAFSGEIIRSGVQQQHMRAVEAQSRRDLAHFSWRCRAEITRADETHTLNIHPGAASLRTFPFVQDCAVRIKAGAKQ